MECDKGGQMKIISNKIFGTEDYTAMIAILPAYDGMIKEFNREVKKLEQVRGEL